MNNIVRNGFRWLAAMTLAAFAIVAHATPITGSIDMWGGFTPVDDGWVATNLGSASGLDFNPLGPEGDMLVLGAYGDFDVLAPLPLLGAIKDIQFSPLASRGLELGDPNIVGPVSDFWTAGVFSFALSSITIENQNDGAITLFGTGVVTGGGFDATLGSWRLTGQTVGSSGVFSWSSSGAAAGVGVPEPGALALLGIGLLGIGAVRLRMFSKG